MPLKISVIATVLNEGEAIRRLMDSLVAQQRPPDEVVIVDGGSSDNTRQVLEGYIDRLPLQILIEPGANISRGRNVAIDAAAGPVIAGVDAGVRLPPNWLAELAAPFQVANPPQTVAGFFAPDPQNTFEVAMSATVLPLLDDIDPTSFLPSSRSVAFTKSAWKAAGGYPEWLDYCEDLIFDFNLIDHAGPFTFAPQALVYFRPRGDLNAFYKQYYRYARGDGKADLWRKRHAVRYITYLLGAPLLLALGLFHRKFWWLLGAMIGVVGLFGTPYQRLPRLWGRLSPAQRLQAITWVPVIRVVGDVAKMIGYPVGLWWRYQRRGDPKLNWRRRVDS